MARWLGWTLLILVSAISTAWLYWQEDAISVRPTDTHLADYTLHDFTLTRFDPNGMILQKLQAVQASHYPAANTQFETVEIWLYQDRQPIWYIQAERGEISEDNSELWLLGHTRLLRQTDKPTEQLEILTADVHLWQDREYLETAAPTTIINAQGTTKGVGMQAWLATRQLQLISQVQGFYLPDRE